MKFPRRLGAAFGLSTAVAFSLVSLPPGAYATTVSEPLSTSLSTSAAPLPDFTANATSEELHLDAASVPGVGSLAETGVGPVSGSVGGSPKVDSSVSNLDADLLSTGNKGLLTQLEQTAPPDNAAPAGKDFLSTNLSPLVSIGTSTATAQSRWNEAGSCLAPGTAISSAHIETAGLGLAGSSLLGGDLLHVDSVQSDEKVSLTGPDSGRTVTSTATGSTASIALLGGAVKIDVAKNPTLTAKATGHASGASVGWTSPVLTVTAAGKSYTLDSANPSVNVGVPGVANVELSLGDLMNVVKSDDGTKASADARLLHLKVTAL
ncbi:MAG: hypothetical protein J2O46_08055, partial [Nocardioides sp.]|nr:hypothetical protein [Nocardioides sp.]